MRLARGKNSGSKRVDVDPSDGRQETADEKADRNWAELLQELRVSQTGTQIISGFLLAVAFQQRFTSLKPPELVLYGFLVGLAALSTLLGVVIVTVHRATFGAHEKDKLVAVSDRMLWVTVSAVALLTVGVVAFIFDFVFGPVPGIVAGVAAAATAGGLMAVLPGRVRVKRR